MHFDIPQIQQFLDTKFNYIHNIEPVADGWWSQALTFYAGEEKLVLRINQHLRDFQKDVFAYRHLNSPGCCIPEVKATGDFTPGYFYCISEFIEGIPADSVLHSEDLTGHEELGRTILTQLDHIHQLDTGHYSGWGFTDINGNGLFNSWPAFLLAFFNSKTSVTWQEFAATTWLDGDYFEKMIEKMKALFPYLPKTRSLQHGDYGYDNLLLTPDNKVAAVIDWAEMMIGDPFYDIIHMCEPWKQNEGLTFIKLWKQMQEEKNQLMPHFDKVLECYNIHYTLFHLHIHTARNDEEGYREIEQWAIENL